MRLHKQAHTVYRNQYHLVWVTRYRHPWLTQGIDDFLKLKLRAVTKYHPDWEIIEIGIDTDHVHLHMVIPPKYSVSSAVNALKSNTAREMKAKFQHWLERWYWDDGGIWSRGFFSSTVGVDEQVIRNYVKQQGEDDAGQAQLALL